MTEVIQEGRNQDEALKAALDKLNAKEEDVDIEVLETQRDGLFGFIGSRPVKIKVTLKTIPTDKNTISDAAPVFSDEPGQPPALPFNGNENPEDVVRDFLSTVFDMLGAVCEMDVQEGENNIFVDITGDDTGVLIGKFGHTLDSLQFLTNVIMTKKYGNRKKILINVGDYRERREKSIHKLSRSVARKVLKTRRPEALAPMPPQDRRIVHLALAEYDRIVTTSEGTGKNRKVIISYKD
ncbi:MAG: RNA-binding cell elongation regulator Jag/EloR [bacterium]